MVYESLGPADKGEEAEDLRLNLKWYVEVLLDQLWINLLQVSSYLHHCIGTEWNSACDGQCRILSLSRTYKLPTETSCFQGVLLYFSCANCAIFCQVRMLRSYEGPTYCGNSCNISVRWLHVVESDRST
jgi:hypothetical protein